MARMELDGIDELVNELEEMGDLSETAPKMLGEAGTILERNLKKNVRIAASNGNATGELVESIHTMPARQNAYGHYTVVGPTGTDKKGLRNGEKMAYLEYGTSRNGKRRQPPRPVMEKTLRESEPSVEDKMQEVFNGGKES